ncbi:unnamed protein product [Spodoptera littoralis]|uniref:Uncharacterized protein n=1 Tax=Spodoptera littoralis TaxID=7109 RepID=A0A9P0IDQ1_SPOLI|nr:unnamed protein product [Spodoptera littoralis]CAH1644905.1 unnamed protein product [Spodoptera littoralis]
MTRSIVLLYCILIKWSILKFVQGNNNMMFQPTNYPVMTVQNEVKVQAEKINNTESNIVSWAEIFNLTDINNNTNSTEILRYGHQQTHKCGSFEKSFQCIQGCLSRGFQIAKADRDCRCFCLKDKTKAKYFDRINSTVTVPTITVPYKYRKITTTSTTTTTETTPKAMDTDETTKSTTEKILNFPTSVLPEEDFSTSNNASATEGGNSTENVTDAGNSTLETNEGGGNLTLDTSEGGNSTLEPSDRGNSTLDTSEGGNSTLEAPEAGNATLGASEADNATLDASEANSTTLDASEANTTTLEASEAQES